MTIDEESTIANERTLQQIKDEKTWNYEVPVRDWIVMLFLLPEKTHQNRQKW